MRRAPFHAMTSVTFALLLAGTSGCLMTHCPMGHHANRAGVSPVLRMGMITGLKPEKMARYQELHAAAWPGVLRQIRRVNIRNYSIYLKELDGQPCLFSYFEYSGRDFAADMKKMAADPETQRWWKETDPCQAPLPAAAARGQVWEDMEEVFHTAGAVDVTPRQVRRFGTVTGLSFEKEAWYRTLHQTPWPGVQRQIREANIRNYSIYLKKIGDKLYLLSYFEYVGDNFEADMERMKHDDVTQRWWQQTDPCQLPLPAAAAKKQIWDGMAEVFHAD